MRGNRRNRPIDDGRVRVLRVIARMNVGGPALQVSTLVEGLPGEDFDHRVVAGELDPGEGDYSVLHDRPTDRLVIRGLGRAVSPIDDLRAWFGLIREIRRFRPHIVHTHTAKAGVLGRTAAFVLRVPITVHTFHGHLLYGYFGPLVTRLVVAVERLLATRTSALVAVGHQVRDELVAAGIGATERFSIIPPGIAPLPEISRHEARRQLGIPSGAPVIVFAGRLTAVKRPDRLIEVARRVQRQHPDLVVAVMGEGDLLDATRTEAADVPGIRFLGWRSDTATIYAAATVVLLTSDNEGVPVSLIEAAAGGRAVVAADVGSVAEIVDDGRSGLLCPPEPGALATAVLRVLGDDGLRARLERHAKLVAARFTGQRLVASHEDLYHRLTGDRFAHPHQAAARPEVRRAPQPEPAPG